MNDKYGGRRGRGRTGAPDRQEARWPVLWVRAAMRTAILICLESGPLHGYGIALALEELGFGRPKGGSLYPILEELKNARAVEDEWEQHEGGPGRRVYRLTDAGRERLSHEREQWGALVDVLVGDSNSTEVSESKAGVGDGGTDAGVRDSDVAGDDGSRTAIRVADDILQEVRRAPNAGRRVAERWERNMR
ncbi:PadR family transcriptional regulator [Bifidobacterium margollesii]|uniref:PadR family transcriptional regulator n=1 Tax=Bifidobacterium margollesii TaxID=2020964 RepID=UPI000C75A41D|nr:PadR family transcriptional regulator [Bifidobacterium margollesii]